MTKVPSLSYDRVVRALERDRWVIVRQQGSHIRMEKRLMITIQITIDELLLSEVDRVAAELHTTRSAFIREALETALRRPDIRKLEQEHAEGYTRHPTEPGEFDIWMNE